MAVCCQNLTPGALSSLSALSMLIGALFKKFCLLLNTSRILEGSDDGLTNIKELKLLTVSFVYCIKINVLY
jgi:hypothetical protein